MDIDITAAVIANIKRLKPIVLANMVADPKLPWFTSIPDESVAVSALNAIITSHIGEGQIKSINDSRGIPTDGKFLKSQEHMVFLYGDEDGEVGGLSYWKRDESTRTMYTAFIRFEDDGTIIHTRNKFFECEQSLDSAIGKEPQKDAAYLFSHILDVAIQSSYSADGTGESVSGIEHTMVDGIDLHIMRNFNAEDLRQGEQIHLSPKQLPKAMRSYLKELSYPDPDEPREQARISKIFAEDVSKKLSNTEQIWWVSPDMSALAWDTVLSGTEPEGIEDEPLPSPSGIMWLDGGVGPALLTKRPLDPEFFTTGVTHSDPLTVNAIVWFVPSREMADIMDINYGKTVFIQLSGSPALIRDSNHWGDGAISHIDLGSAALLNYRVVLHSPLAVREVSGKLVRTAIRLSRESVVGEQQIERVITGGKKRKPVQIDDVVLAVLRRRRYATEAEREQEAREYSHRWIVRGHMRNQPFGSRTAEGGQRHERIWIAPYIKGPEDKPLVVKDRVQVWRR